jgi:hypothetical protein
VLERVGGKSLAVVAEETPLIKQATAKWLIRFQGQRLKGFAG